MIDVLKVGAGNPEKKIYKIAKGKVCTTMCVYLSLPLSHVRNVWVALLLALNCGFVHIVCQEFSCELWRNI